MTKHHGDMHTSLFLLGASLVIVASNLVEAGVTRYVVHNKLIIIFLQPDNFRLDGHVELDDGLVQVTFDLRDILGGGFV